MDAFSYIWTGSCIVNPEYEPEDMLKAVLHALASSETQDTPFLAVMILPVWEDTVELCCHKRPPQHVNPHPDSGGAQCGLFPDTNKPMRSHLSSPRRSGQWNLCLSPIPRGGNHFSNTNEYIGFWAPRFETHTSSRRNKHGSSQAHPHLGAISGAALPHPLGDLFPSNRRYLPGI
jgi:hypothetical protein